MDNLTNYQLWNIYTQGSPSPDKFLDWAWLFTISSALQRRVWIGSDSPDEHAIFSNMYVILVGGPGVGKGTAIKPSIELLTYWDKKHFKPNIDKLSDSDKLTAETLTQQENEIAVANESQGKNKSADLFNPKLFPDAGDATTYESLVENVSKSYSRINYTAFCPKRQKDSIFIYGHASMYFGLPELNSLFRKKAEDTVNYLLGIYDCPVEYKYSTKTKGKDRVRRGCINLIAGCVPEFIQSTFTDELLNSGFSSRTFFVYATANRRSQFFYPPVTDEAREAKKQLLEHLLKLASLYGRVNISDEARIYLNEWYIATTKNRFTRSNSNALLDHYYARLQQHVQKVALAKHFSESLDMEISLDTFKWAIEFLAKEEKTMHHALIAEAKNPQFKCAKMITELLASGPKPWIDIYLYCIKILDKRGIEETLEFMQETKQIVCFNEKDEDLDKEILKWRIV